MTPTSSTQPLLETVRQQTHPGCCVCDPSQPEGLALDYHLAEDQTIEATFACPHAWQGYPGLVHGGIIATITDGALTNALFARGVVAVTADLQLRYRHPVRLGEAARVTAKVTRFSPPLFVVEAWIEQAGQVCVRGEGKFLRRPRDQKGSHE
ncbi:MAG: PaaI family thioesterase [Phycisphaeraceae bacterium]